MSKKIAAGADAIVLDVKVGHGAFMETEDEAVALAELMVRIGARLGRKMTALIGDMTQPLGLAVGNALEVVEAVQTLHGAGPEDFRQHCVDVAGEMLLIAGRAPDPESARVLAARALVDGSAWEKFCEFVTAQGGDVATVEDTTRLPWAPVTAPFMTPRAADAARLDAREIGYASVDLGGGRARKGDPIDPAVGILLAEDAKVGRRVMEGQPLLWVHARSRESLESVLPRLRAALSITSEPVALPPLVHRVIRHAGLQSSGTG
jgi:pyrimidine-nucleoside phosphorylase